MQYHPLKNILVVVKTKKTSFAKGKLITTYIGFLNDKSNQARKYHEKNYKPQQQTLIDEDNNPIRFKYYFGILDHVQSKFKINKITF